MQIIPRPHGNGNNYFIEFGDRKVRLKLSRNYSGNFFRKWKNKGATPYFIEFGSIYVGATEEEMLELFAAFLMVRNEYENPLPEYEASQI